MVGVYMHTILPPLPLTSIAPAASSSILTPSDMDGSKNDETMSPAPHTILIGHSENPRNSSIDMTPRPSAFYARSHIRFVLGNFFVAMFLISLVILIIFFAVAWFILRDTRSMNLQVFSNSTGVSLYLHHKQMLLMTRRCYVAIVSNHRRQPSTGSSGIRIIHFMESHRLRRGHNLWGSVLGRSYPRPL